VRGRFSSAVPVAALRRPYALLALTVPLAFGAVAIPQSEVIEIVNTARVVEAASQQAGVLDPALTPRLSLVVQPTGFSLVTPRIRDDFLSGRRSPDRFTLSLVEAEFFSRKVPYGSLIYREARRNGLPPELVAAVVETESDFRARLISSRDARGLMQVIPSTGALMGANNLMDPADNIRVGTRYLRYLHDRFEGDWDLILAAYNAGESTVRRYGGIPPYRETQNYLRRVARAKARYEKRMDRELVRRFGQSASPETSLQ
jgi:hypothetical protein